MSTTTLPAAAIDLGLHTTKYCFSTVSNRAEPDRCGYFRSMAAILPAQLGNEIGYRLGGVHVTVKGLSYLVGPIAQRILGATALQRTDDTVYFTAEYQALLLGALWHIARDAFTASSQLSIENLTLGLPMPIPPGQRQSLQEFVRGEHVLPPIQPGGSAINLCVKQVSVLGNPHGALLYYSNKIDSSVKSENVLVADLGGGTFDWISCSSMVPNLPRWGHHDRGMLNAATEACKVIAPQAVDDLDLLARIDEALRTGKTEVKISGRMVPFDQGITAANKVVDEALLHMSVSIGSTAAIDRVLLAGGGAPLLKARLPHVLPDLVDLAQMIEQPFFANLRGFLYFSVQMHDAE